MSLITTWRTVSSEVAASYWEQARQQGTLSWAATAPSCVSCWVFRPTTAMPPSQQLVNIRRHWKLLSGLAASGLSVKGTRAVLAHAR